jgi:hypothetical protein
LAKHLTPEQKHAKNARYRANRATREAEGESPVTAAQRPPKEQVEGGQHVAGGRVADHRLGLITGECDASHLMPRFDGDDPGLLAQATERWRHLVPLWGHDKRRRPMAVTVVCRPEYLHVWTPYRERIERGEARKAQQAA